MSGSSAPRTAPGATRAGTPAAIPSTYRPSAAVRRRSSSKKFVMKTTVSGALCGRRFRGTLKGDALPVRVKVEVPEGDRSGHERGVGPACRLLRLKRVRPQRVRDDHDLPARRPVEKLRSGSRPPRVFSPSRRNLPLAARAWKGPHVHLPTAPTRPTRTPASAHPERRSETPLRTACSETPPVCPAPTPSLRHLQPPESSDRSRCRGVARRKRARCRSDARTRQAESSRSA